MHPSFAHTHHRPWPLPAQRWVGRQSWCELLFAHWPVPVERLQALVPAPLRVQSWDGTGWVGVVPFRMHDVMLRGVPALPWLSAFPELNVRTYVEHDGKPGVWFFSLDATQPVAVWAARRFVHLPYHRADIRFARESTNAAATTGATIDFASRRRGVAAAPIGLTLRYRPTGPVFAARPDTLEHFLTERYCLYARSPRGLLYRTEVHHAPWPLQPATAEIHTNTIATPAGLPLSGPPALLHYASRIDVATWPPNLL